MRMATAGISAILDAVGDVVASLFTPTTGWVPVVINTIVAQPILLLGFILSVSGLAVGMVKRLVNIK